MISSFQDCLSMAWRCTQCVRLVPPLAGLVNYLGWMDASGGEFCRVDKLMW